VSAAEEIEWLRQVAKCNRAAFEKLYALHAPRVFRFVHRMLRDEKRAEDLTHDVWVEVWKTARRFDGRTAPSTWILGIARARTLEALRGGAPTAPVGGDGTPARTDAASEAETDPATVRRQRRHRELRSRLAGLAPEQRELLELTFFHGCSYQEIAEIVRCPPKTVQARMLDTRQRLRPLLAQHGGSGEPA